LLPDTDPIEAVFIANRILDGLREYYFAAPLGTVGITASVGAAESGDHPGKLEHLIRGADQKLYQAKCEGKDRVAY
jgi:diguanylate cyclase (GGDEF)-like protein